MQAVGEEWVKQELGKEPGAVFRMGFHSIPSMRQLHLHVISQARPRRTATLLCHPRVLAF